MKIVLLGPGDISKIWKYGKLTEEEVWKLIDKFAKFLADNKFEIIFVPSRGIHYEIAKKYKEYGGPKVIGVIPREDKRFGIKHIEKYFGLVDEEVSIKDWYNLNGEIGSMGDITICFGLSPGAIIDMSMMSYHYRYLDSKVPLLVYRLALSVELPKEVEEGLPYLEYVDSFDELKKKILEKVNK